MSELVLARDKKIELRSQAHHVTFSVLVGASGLTDAVIKEVDRALAAHGLIKVHVAGDDREERVEFYAKLADALNAARIQAIGKTLVLYRPVEEKKESAPERKAPVKKKRAPKKGQKAPTRAKKTRAGARSRVTKKKALTN